jgi:L-lysine 6-transaminase
MAFKTSVKPDNVKEILSKHLIADGYDIVVDLEKSDGLTLIDARNGDEYLDFYSFFASSPLGFNHPKLANDEFRQKLGKVAVNKPSNSDMNTLEKAEFVERFDRVGIPDYLPHAFFISGGTLAVENALKAAFDWKVRKNFQKGYRYERGYKVMHFEQAFHGRSGYTMSLTNTLPNKTKYFLQFDWPRVLNPAMTFPATEEHINQTIEKEELAITQAERYFELYKDEIACILIEPIQAEGGDHHFRPEFHHALRKLADEHEALLIHDEVQTGVGLTGKFWAHEHYVKPDILAFGKKMQVCGILAGKRIDDIEDNVFHVSSRINSTWGGNLVDMVRSGQILTIIDEENLVENAAETGKYLQQKINDLAENYEYITNPRGKGLFCAIDLPDTHTRDAVLKECIKNKLLILGCGTHSIRFRPPLIAQKQHIDEGIEIIEKAYKAAASKCPAISN